MKKYLLIIVIGLFFWTNYLNAHINTIDYHHNPFGFLEKKYPECHSDGKEQTVYICTGPYAYAYHSSSSCPGLSNCSAQINYVDEGYASNVMRRVPCCRCWSNVGGRCKDDNPYQQNTGGGSSGGGSTGDAYAVLALAAIATGAILISNDVYWHPLVFSFYKNSGTIGRGQTFGLRKTFDHSALEYGCSYLTNQTAYYDFYGNIYFSDETRWGYHLNYVHQLLSKNFNNSFKFYVGPSLNYVKNWGIGGLIIGQYTLFDRLKLDVRYELTSQTNQLQLGLVFTYQKEYFWKR
jgi:hypothetical protein